MKSFKKVILISLMVFLLVMVTNSAFAGDGQVSKGNISLAIGEKNLTITNLGDNLKLDLSGLTKEDYSLSTNNDQTELVIKVNNKGVVSDKKAINRWGIKDIRLDSSSISISFDKAFSFTESYENSQLRAQVNFMQVGLQEIDNIIINGGKDKSIVQVASQGNLEFTSQNVAGNKLYVDIPKAGLALAEEQLEQTISQGPIQKIKAAEIPGDMVRLEVDLADKAVCNVVGQDGYVLLMASFGGDALKDKTIVLDPGHGNFSKSGYVDPGAVGRDLKLRESDVVLNISNKLKDSLTKEGANVIMTRTKNGVPLSLTARAAVANKNNADAFVSIHANASLSRAHQGSSVYMYAPFSNQNLYKQREVRTRLAADIQREIVKSGGRKDLGVLEANFSVLRNTQIPSVLVETAFLSNAQEEKLLSTDSFCQKMADGILNGLKSFFNKN